MKKTTITIIVSLIAIIAFIVLGFLNIISFDIVPKTTIFLSAIVVFSLSYTTGYKKGKNGLSNGVIIGITFGIISLIIHYFSKTNHFDTFFIRALVFMISGASGGIIGVNAKTK